MSVSIAAGLDDPLRSLQSRTTLRRATAPRSRKRKRNGRAPEAERATAMPATVEVDEDEQATPKPAAVAMAARREARRHLPAPAEVARDIAMALFEVEAGCRSAAQLERVFSPELWDRLEHQVRRSGGPLPSCRGLIRVHYQELVPGLANIVAIVQRGARVQPVAMRLDAYSGRWLVTELRY